MRIVHLTDPHLSSLAATSLRALRGKRRLGYLSWWRRRRHQFDPALLAPLQAAVRADAPDLIAVTGDLVHIGLRDEMAEARPWLAALQDVARVVLVPGNHDCYAPDSPAHVQELWADYLPPDASAGTLAGVVQYGDIAVIGLASARPQPWWSAGGKLGPAQLATLSRELMATRGRFRCVLLHHPPLPGMSGWRKGLRDAPALARLLREHAVELVLHGHVHRNQCQVFAGHTRVVASAPAISIEAGRMGSYRVFDIEGSAESWHVRMQLKTLAPDRTFEFATRTEWCQVRSATVAGAAVTPCG